MGTLLLRGLTPAVLILVEVRLIFPARADARGSVRGSGYNSLCRCAARVVPTILFADHKDSVAIVSCDGVR
ncbi:MAG TPA: hypothetical protein VGQ81_13275 [Acidobacteriota bacterium]|jgi:hypothetical protein|nr:hypothetical protein [Acidobacteriota bacterium]